MSYCCAECFSDSDLKKQVEEDGKDADGSTCDYCGSSGRLFDVGRLTHVFRELVDHFFIKTNDRVDAAYMNHAAEGEYLDQLFDADFDVFSEKLRASEQRRALLFDILDNGRDPRRDVVYDDDSYWCSKDSQPFVWSINDYWGTLKSAILRQGHDLLIGAKLSGSEDERDAYDVILQELERLPSTLDKGYQLWRARSGKGHRGQSLGAPPPDKAKAARANLQNQPVLYLSVERETVLREIRSSVGTVISVGQFQVVRTLKICDLIPHFEIGSPFKNFEAFVDVHQRNELRGALGLALAKPVAPGDEERDYVPTQFLCQMICKAGYNGVVFSSVQHPRVQAGYHAPQLDEFHLNYVLFDPMAASPTGIAEDLRITGLAPNLKYEVDAIV